MIGSSSETLSEIWVLYLSFNKSIQPGKKNAEKNKYGEKGNSKSHLLEARTAFHSP